MPVSNSQLHHLAGLYGIRTSYLDMNDHVQPASEPALLSILESIGAPVKSIDDVPAAIRETQQNHWRQPVEPVIVVWEKETLTINLRLPATLLDSSISGYLRMEDGTENHLIWKPKDSSVIDSVTIEHTKYISTKLYYPERLPCGYHSLKLDLLGQTFETLIIVAPLKAYAPAQTGEKIWGTFLPLYALKTQQSQGIGDFSDLEKMMRWTAGLGGQLTGTLPLLPSFIKDKFGPSPYMPASRLFWNELYLDLERIPEMENCPSAKEVLNLPQNQKALTAVKNTHRVDYEQVLSLKRQVLEILCSNFLRDRGGRFTEYKNFLGNNQTVIDYGRFRAASEQHGYNWKEWPRRMMEGKLEYGDYPEPVAEYYMYTQWLAQEQIEAVCKKARQAGVYLYLDLPVGVHPHSYDVWRERESFVMGVNGGAPPDPVFTSGQNWCFPPLHPEKIRQQGYRYLINCLRHQLQKAGMLRIDHMMNFHRLFWIPEEMENREGVYVNYHAEELYAILTLESVRQKSIIIGEDLGMVPPEVRPMMEKHGIYRMFVGQYELIAENQLGKIPSQAVASLNTHDMFPFAAFWEETDIVERQKLKLIDPDTAQKELEQRRQTKMILLSILKYRGLNNEISQDTGATLRAVLNLLAESPAYAVLINLEDLWLETRPQNVPGTQRKQNWSQKAHCTFEQFSNSPLILEILKEINRKRKSPQSFSSTPD